MPNKSPKCQKYFKKKRYRLKHSGRFGASINSRARRLRPTGFSSFKMLEQKFFVNYLTKQSLMGFPYDLGTELNTWYSKKAIKMVHNHLPNATTHFWWHEGLRYTFQSP
jgi:hypothetical protein